MGDTAPRNRSGSIGAWYSGSYGNITRTTRLRASPFMPGGLRNTNTDVTIPLDVGATPAGLRTYGQTGGPTAINPTDNIANAPAIANPKSVKGKGGKKGETLFGPDLGLEENDSEGWITGADRKEKVPLSVVKDWVENAKKEEQGVHQTTTLQALVNLKRPTLTLVPVPQDEIVPAETNTDHVHHDPAASRASIERAGAIRHVLRFNYDCSAPRVQISVSIHPRFMNNGTPRLIFTCNKEGGFAKGWELPHENALDIGQAMEDEKRAEEELLSAAKKLDGEGSEGSDGDDDYKKPAQIKRETVNPVVPPEVATMSAQALIENQPQRRSFLNRVLRQRRNNDLEQGIIADIRRQQGGDAVEMRPVGADGTNAITGQTDEATGTEAALREEEGLRVIIRLDALNEDNSALTVINAQATHVLLAGATVGGPATASRPAINNNPGTSALANLPEEATEGNDGAEQAAGEIKRVWFIKVVRREAIIGQHTFLLKEIYGLASSSHNDGPVASDGDQAATDDPMASTPNECIVCLTNPRDVVLLPCRHLVVCRECAVGMIEFGAGGKVARREDATEATGPGNEGATAENSGESSGSGASNTLAAATGVVATTIGGRERRKKKGKGWFCPVCRQPYTSLLRLALPANEMSTIEIEAVMSAALSRQPSIGAAPSIRSFRHSLHRSSSRATLPERGERMLEDIAHDNAELEDEDYENDDNYNRNTTSSITPNGGHEHRTVPPTFVLGDQIDISPRSVQDSTPREMARESDLGRTSLEGRRSFEGKGWKEAV